MLNRDARHHALAQVGEAGQRAINAGSALVLGAGGIGCAAATYLASSGVGRLHIVDFDTIDPTNLARQFLYSSDDVGEFKAAVASRKLVAQNPDIRIAATTSRLQGAALRDAINAVDVVLDGTDNFATRFQVNAACVAAGKRLISGSAIRLEGQVAVFGPDFFDGPCYQCLYQEADESLDSCAGNGVLATVPGVIGTLMATEALKTFAGLPTTTDTLHIYDAAATEFRSIRIQKRPDCPICAKSA